VTPEELEALLQALDADREQAALRYEAVRRKLTRLFEWRGCAAPEDLADVTIDRVARQMARGLELRLADPYGYFCGVAHLVYKELLRRQAREEAALESGDWPPVSADDPPFDERLDLLRDCLQSLDEEQRCLVLRYHQEDDHIRTRRELSAELGLPLNALRIRVHRLRRKLEECIAEKLRP
jgi:DNA-directed RNA polymerase specialized sigma24 family protein